jgi:hypothetical protein
MSTKILSRIAVALLFVSLIACHKFIDVEDLWHKHNPACRVEKITYWPYPGSESNTGRFYYNSKGNPRTVVFDEVGTGRPNLYFKYNHSGKLTDYIAPYNNNHYEIWYQYQYDHMGRIIRDTLYSFGTFIDSVPYPNNDFKSYATYEYDLHERIVKVTRHHLSGSPLVQEDVYTYDSDGNRATRQRFYNGVDQGTEIIGPYDDKVSIRRTNRIWMFIGHDYSKNNPKPAINYNSKGLPLKFSLALPSFFFHFVHEVPLNESEIEYKCK